MSDHRDGRNFPPTALLAAPLALVPLDTHHHGLPRWYIHDVVIYHRGLVVGPGIVHEEGQIIVKGHLTSSK